MNDKLENIDFEIVKYAVTGTPTRKLAAGWSVEIKEDIYGRDPKPKLVDGIDAEYMINNEMYKFYDILGVVESNGDVVVYKKGKRLKTKITKEEFNKRYFTEMI